MMFQLFCTGLSIMKPMNKLKVLSHLDISLEFVLTSLGSSYRESFHKYEPWENVVRLPLK